MTTEARLLLVPYGPTAVGALGDAIAASKHADELAPVTVVMPSTHAAITVRRRLVRDRAGLVNTQFVSMPQLAGHLAAPSLAGRQRQVLTPVRRTALIRKVLAGAPPPFDLFSGAAIEQSLDATFAELADLDEGALTRQAGTSARADAVIALYRRFREVVGDDIDEHTVVETAAAAVRAGTADLDAVGQVVVHLPRRLSRAELDLVSGLAARDRVTVLVGRTGSAEADAGAEQLLAALVPVLGAPLAVPVEPVPARVRFVRAPDPEEEVRAAIRVVLVALATTPADRIALVSRVAEPHHRLLAEQLDAAGVPHHAPGTLRLAQTAAGRAVVGLLTLPLRDFRRGEVFRWLAASPLRGPTGRRIRVGHLDRVARRAGVSSGVDGWHERLDRRRAELAERRAEATENDDDAGISRADQQLAAVDELGELFDWLVQRCTPPAGGGWRELARWADDALVGLLGEPSRQLDWPDDDLAAYEAVRATLEELGGLDEVDGDVTPELFARVVLDQLERPARPVGAFGRGVFVGGLADLAGADHDLVVVLDMAETRHPPRGSDDPLIPDHERRRTGALPQRRPARADELRDHLAAVASGAEVVLSFARSDTRAGREQLPSRWWLKALSDVVGRPLTADDLDVPEVLTLPSFIDAPSRGATSTTTSEHTASILLQAREQHGRTALPALTASLDPVLGRGALAVRDRASGVFSEWTGLVGPDALVDDDPTVGVASATRYERWATCPFRFFLTSVLDVRELDEFGEADSISSLDRGSLMHEVLERFHGLDLSRPPDKPFDGDDLRQLRAIARQVGDEFRDRGVTGRPLLWQLASEEMVRRLETLLEYDEKHRHDRGVSPGAVELRFGDDAPVPAVRIELDGGRVVEFRGMVDRIDVSPDGRRIVVFDYKTGKPDKYKGCAHPGKPASDITWRGEHLQLALYAEAATQCYPHAEEIEAYFWFVDEPNKQYLLGGPITDSERARLRTVLQTIVDGIGNGWFPANPGEEGFFGHEHCGWCPYDRICPGSRSDLWESVRLSPHLTRYTDLAEGPLPAPPTDGDGDVVEPVT